MNTLMLSNVSFLVIARAWGLESAVSFGLALKLYAESYASMTNEDRATAWGGVVKNLGIVCGELNDLSSKNVQMAKAQLEHKLRQGELEVQQAEHKLRQGELEVQQAEHKLRQGELEVRQAEQRLMQEAVHTREQVGLAAARVAEAEAVASAAVTGAANAERDLQRKKMSAFRRLSTWIIGES
jgi:predicted nucleic acid-binding protein